MFGLFGLFEKKMEKNIGKNFENEGECCNFAVGKA